MTRLRMNSAGVLTLALATACAKDPVSNPSERQGRPDAASSAVADRGGSDADGSGSRFVASWTTAIREIPPGRPRVAVC